MHEMISEAEYRRQIGKTAGRAYLFFGEEDYLKSYAVRATREAICPDPTFAVFNDIAIDAADYTPDALLNAMTPPPMMAEGRFILLRGLDFTAMKQSELDALIETLALLPEYDFNTVAVHIAAGMIDEGYLPKRPSATLKRLSEVATPVRFDAVSEARLTAWVGKHFAHFGVAATPACCAFLITYAGRSMFLLANEIENSFIPAQFDNPSNPMAHYFTTGPEIVNDTDGKVDIFVCGVGTGGTITGTGRYLKEKCPHVKIVAVEPDTSAVLSGDVPGPHGLQGIGAGFIPSILDTEIYDEIIRVTNEEAYQMGAELGKTEGLLVGISAGAALHAAITLAKRPENENKNIVVLLPDTGDRYLSTAEFDE